MIDRTTLPRPHFFGPGDQLFGAYHPATPGARNDVSVLLCPPLGQEQIRTHRLYRQLATALAAQGTPCLRFDYFGCGDSAGHSGERDWERCKDDIAVATSQLRQLAGQSRVIAFGARLGASLAIESATRARLDGFVLWDAVLDVMAMVERMDALQQRLVRDPEHFLVPREADSSQWSGFAVSEQLRAQLVAACPGLPKAPTLHLRSFDGPTASASDTDLSQAVTLSHAAAWEDIDRLEFAILSHELVRTVCQWVEGFR